MVDVAAEGIWNLEIGRNNSKYLLSTLWLATVSIADLASENGAEYKMGMDAPQMQKNKFIVGSFRLCSVLLTEGSILDTCYEVW